MEAQLQQVCKLKLVMLLLKLKRRSVPSEILDILNPSGAPRVEQKSTMQVAASPMQATEKRDAWDVGKQYPNVHKY